MVTRTSTRATPSIEARFRLQIRRKKIQRQLRERKARRESEKVLKGKPRFKVSSDGRRVVDKLTGKSISLASVGGSLTRATTQLITKVTPRIKKTIIKPKLRVITRLEVTKDQPIITRIKKPTDKALVRTLERLKIKPKEQKPLLLTVEPIQEIKESKLFPGTGRVRQQERLIRGKLLTKLQRTKPEEIIKREFLGIAVLGALGVARGVLGVAEVFRHPIQTVKSQITALKTPRQTFLALGQQFTIDPVGTVAEFVTFSKGLGIAGRTIKKSPVGRFVQEELFIRKQPKELQPSVRTIIKSAKTQEKLNPTPIKTLKSVDFLEVKTLKSKAEADALKKALENTDSVVFGSLASRAISKKKTPLPKDVDLATKDIAAFSKEFIKNLPNALKKDFVLKGQKLVRKSTGEALFDVKPISRLIPRRSLLTGKGLLPVAGFTKKLTLGESLLPEFKRTLQGDLLQVPTQKLVKIGKIKLVGFGEQTTRKALGTLQVLLEKNVRRAKDPQAFVVSLQVQVNALKKLKPSSRKIKKLQDAIKLLKSTSFAKLLESKVSGITKEFPILKNLNPKELRKLTSKTVKERIRRLIKRQEQEVFKKVVVPGKKVRPTLEKPFTISKLPKFKPSRLPSKIPPSKIPRVPAFSKLPILQPSKVPFIKPSKLIPSKLKKPRPSKIPPSKLQEIKISKLVPSEIPRSKLGPSEIPRSKLGDTEVPRSKLGPSEIPRSKIPKLGDPPPPPIILPPKVSKTLKRGQGHVILVRRKGKFQQLVTNVMTRKQAEGMARFLVDNSVAASFKVQRISKSVNTKISDLQDLKRKFRSAKRNPTIRVERRKFRIDTLGEVRGLRIAKLAKQSGLRLSKPKVTKSLKRINLPINIKVMKL